MSRFFNTGGAGPHRVFPGCLYKRPTVGRISSVSTVALGGSRMALDDGVGDCGGRHHFFPRGLRPESVPDIGVWWRRAAERLREFPWGAILLASVLVKPSAAVFRGGVGSRSSEDAIGRDGEIVHDGAATLHDGERGLRHQKCAGQVGIDHVLPERQGQLVYCEIGVGDAGVVDEDIEALELVAEGAEEIVDRLRIADVAGVREDFNFRRGQFPADAAQRLLRRGRLEPDCNLRRPAHGRWPVRCRGWRR